MKDDAGHEKSRSDFERGQKRDPTRDTTLRRTVVKKGTAIRARDNAIILRRKMDFFRQIAPNT
ncbi:MAG TPA: hypothetical protein VGH49_10155 [Xanthobacteraceae bacterium]|jgi:hypothetical protein